MSPGGQRTKGRRSLLVTTPASPGPNSSQRKPRMAAMAGPQDRGGARGGKGHRTEKLNAPPAPLQIVKLQLIDPRESRPSRHRPPAKVTFVDATKTFAARNASGCHSTVINYCSRSLHKGTFFLQNTKSKIFGVDKTFKIFMHQILINIDIVFKSSL